MRKLKFFALLIVPVLAGCNHPLPLPGPAPKLARPAQTSLAAKILPPLRCKGAACWQPAVRAAAFVTDAPAVKPAAKATAVKPPPAPPSPGGPRLSALIARDELEMLAKARLVFNAPEQMSAGLHERVEAHMTDNVAEDLAARLKELGISSADEIIAGTTLQARLAGDGFDINPLSDEEKDLSGEVLTPWVWDVTPVRHGAQSLQLTVTIKVKVPGNGDERKELPVLARPITVATSKLYSTVRFLRARWPWFIGGFFTLAAAAWFFRRRGFNRLRTGAEAGRKDG